MFVSHSFERKLKREERQTDKDGEEGAEEKERREM